jgi:hypothetical protein
MEFPQQSGDCANPNVPKKGHDKVFSFCPNEVQNIG